MTSGRGWLQPAASYSNAMRKVCGMQSHCSRPLQSSKAGTTACSRWLTRQEAAAAAAVPGPASQLLLLLVLPVQPA
jgi:hypothetical protein